jgi:ribonuclease Y
MPELQGWLVIAFALDVILIGLVISMFIYFNKQLQTARTQRIAKETEATEHLARAQEEATRLIDEARTRQKELILEARDEQIRLRASQEAEAREQRTEIARLESRIRQKEEGLDRKLEGLDARDRKLQTRERESDQIRAQLDRANELHRLELERIASLSTEEARRILLDEVAQEVTQEANRLVRDLEQTIMEEGEARARKILAIAMARAASDFVPELTVTTVPLPSEEMKGRIIGREGRNIRALEKATGVDLIIDETPESITLSGFDPVRREVARRSLQKLIADGRIHPARIEEVVEKSQQEVEIAIREAGERAAVEANVPGLHPDLIKLLGRLGYRTSYGQNQLQHAIEASRIASSIAAELGADVNVAKTAALLHDIGKAVDHEVEGPHALIGADIARRLGRSAKIVHAIASHHHEEEPVTVESWIVQAADALSGGRPGARRDSVENYIKRLEALENVANSFDGVERCYAIQAGREVRILVKPDSIDDLGAMRLARDIVKKIEESLEYPGQIKVTVIRETRAVDYAK